MKTTTKIIIGIVVLGAGVGGYLFYRKMKQKNVSDTTVGDMAKMQSQPDPFCNPPVGGFSELERNFMKEQYQKKIAMQEWERRGRGMNPDYFFELYKKEKGC